MGGHTYRIRFHGRGGQGIKTASRVLGSALFAEGFQVQDAPRYGAERRGAPIFAYVRASRQPVHERGIIREPDLVLVADDSLLQVPGAGVRVGLRPETAVWIRSHESAQTWKQRIQIPGPTFVRAPAARDERAAERFIGMECAGAGARMLGVVSREALASALRDELEGAAAADAAHSMELALAAFDDSADAERVVQPGHPGDAEGYVRPQWVALQHEGADVSAPSIHGAATSVAVRTGLWRTMRPVIDHDRCHRCNWMCALPCPDSAIEVDAAGYPHVDLDHCKGCLICVAQCPFHVIEARPEHAFAQEEVKP